MELVTNLFLNIEDYTVRETKKLSASERHGTITRLFLSTSIPNQSYLHIEEANKIHKFYVKKKNGNVVFYTVTGAYYPLPDHFNILKNIQDYIQPFLQDETRISSYNLFWYLRYQN